jgi:hypothetical protein
VKSSGLVVNRGRHAAMAVAEELMEPFQARG